ncbi:MAG: right-handed parallel beta-helix repeat-containing protein [Acidobacteria bacterium]|nr:right-handed parallel beta-helix repeat-containing protein [Acidobacteriota bacterium]
MVLFRKRLFDLLPLFGLAVVALAVASQSRTGTSYYVDSSTGSDDNDGLSEKQAWKSLDKVNSVRFGPGDRILFRAGTRYTGQLRPQGSGNEGKPIVIETYGRGAKPLIAAEGKHGEALLLTNQDYWEVNNLALTNTGPRREEFRYGARVRSWDYGTMRHIHLKNLFVHDVNGSLVKRDPGEGHGITWENGGGKVRSRFDELLIEGCHLQRTDRNGICGYAAYRGNQAKELPSLNVVIRRNLLEDIGGDAIKVWGCDGALVEYNVVSGARQRCDDYAAGIWPWASDNTVIQFNEVSGVKGAKDGQAFDSDGFCTNTTFQYNYSHDNDGGFMLICCSQSNGTVVRYNISQNDRTRLFHMAGPIRNIEVYNNVFYVGQGIDLHLFLWTGGGEGWPQDAWIRNNIFYVEGVGRNSSAERRSPANDGTHISEAGFGRSGKVVFERNVLHGNFTDIPAEWRAMLQDPMLVQPGRGQGGFDGLHGYKLRAASPCIGAGVEVKNHGGRDFWGDPVPQGRNPSIGAHERR